MLTVAKSDLNKSTATGLLAITGFTPTDGPLVDGIPPAASFAQSECKPYALTTVPQSRFVVGMARDNDELQLQ